MFRGPSGQNQLYHTPFLFKILDLTENKKIVTNPFKHKTFKAMNYSDKETSPDQWKILLVAWPHLSFVSETICKQYDIFCSGLHNLSISFVNNIVFESFIYWSKGIDSTQWNLHHSSKNHPQALNKQNPVRLTNRIFFLKYFSDWQTEAKFREKYFSDQASFGRSWWRTGMKIKVLVKTSMWT